MKLDSSRFSLRIVLALALSSVVTFKAAAAPRVNLGDLAEHLAADAKKEGVKSVAVADFLSADGHGLELGWYLAGKLSDDLLAKAVGFRLLDHAEITNPKVSEDEADSAELLKRVGGIWGVEAIVTGAVEISAQEYVVTATLRRATDGAVIGAASQTLPHSRILDLLSPAGADADAAKPVKAGVLGVGVPVCTYCPIPGYSEKARAAKVQFAAVELMVSVSTKGSVERVSVVKNPGYGLAEAAIEGVSDWKMRPALGKDGSPVPVDVPINITFNLSRT